MTSILAVTAHPDDESFLFGGALALHAAAGGKAGLLCLTDGQAGRTSGCVLDDDLGDVRRRELRTAVQILGIPHLFTPGLMDGALREIGDESGTALVARWIERFVADVVLTFGPEGASGHEDHRACWRWTLAAAGARRVYAATFPEPPPGGEPLPVTTVIDVSAVQERKRQAFLAHPTQRDHLERFDAIMETLDGKEYYHRARPDWVDGTALETAFF